MSVNICELTYKEFSELVPRKVDTAILPIGTIEAHGCTNLGTDITIPEFIAREIAGKINALIAPTINYGITRSLLPYPGSMTVSQDSFIRYVGDVMESLFRAGFKKLVIINGHGGHIDELKKLAIEVWRKTGGKTIIIHWWELVEPMTREFFGEAGGHAGLDETAMVLAANPELVKPELCKDVIPYQFRAGTYVYPAAGPIILYKPGEGMPMFDLEKAKEYARKVVDFIADFIVVVFKGWEKNLAEKS